MKKNTFLMIIMMGIYHGTALLAGCNLCVKGIFSRRLNDDSSGLPMILGKYSCDLA